MNGKLQNESDTEIVAIFDFLAFPCFLQQFLERSAGNHFTNEYE